MRQLSNTYIGYTVCNGVSSNIEVVRQLSVFYKEHIYHKGMHNDLEVKHLEEVNRLLIQSSTAIWETTEAEATGLIPYWIKFLNMFSPSSVKFQAFIPEGSVYEKYGFYSKEKIEFFTNYDLIEKAKLIASHYQGKDIEKFMDFVTECDNTDFNILRESLIKLLIMYS